MSPTKDRRRSGIWLCFKLSSVDHVVSYDVRLTAQDDTAACELEESINGKKMSTTTDKNRM